MKTHNPGNRTVRSAFASGCLAAALATGFFLPDRPAQAQVRQTLHGHVPPAVAGLKALGSLPSTQPLRLGIGLPWRNREALTNLLNQLYDPASTNFHRYLTPQQFTEKFGPTGEDYQAVIAFAKSHGLTVTSTNPGRALVDVEGQVADVEAAFHVTLRTYDHPRESRSFYATDTEPSLDLAVPVLAIGGLDNYTLPHPHAAGRTSPNGGGTANSGSDPAGRYAWTDFRNAYAPGTTLTGAGEQVGLLELDGYNVSDINEYETEGGLASVPLKNVLVDGVSNIAGVNNLEVALDIEMVVAMAPGITRLLVYEGSDGNDVLQEMANPTQGETIPHQISSSWGFGVNGSTAGFLQQLAAEGVSVFFASGDTGAFPSDPGGIEDQFYITFVGGTALSMTGAGISYKSESVWNNTGEQYSGKWLSSGGILTSVGLPDFQQGINMSANQGSTTHRNVPDVAMVADNILSISTISTNTPPTKGVHFFTWGTSAASPLWAGYTALANQQAAGSGQPPVGFLNPALYAIGEGPLSNAAYNDVTTGNNEWSGSPGRFNAVTGYDLCTGWGSPTGASMINALESYAGPVFVDFNYTGVTQDGSYKNPFKTMAGGTNAVSTHGTIIIKTAGSSTETMTIAKPMSIIAVGGAATIGH